MIELISIRRHPIRLLAVHDDHFRPGGLNLSALQRLHVAYSNSKTVTKILDLANQTRIRDLDLSFDSKLPTTEMTYLRHVLLRRATRIVIKNSQWSL
jgi:hypothetical protein